MVLLMNKLGNPFIPVLPL